MRLCIALVLLLTIVGNVSLGWHDHVCILHWADDRIKRCCNTQEIAQEVHGTTSLDLKDVKAYVGEKVTFSLCYPSA